MLTSPDFIELLSIMARHEVRYLVVGGYAVMRYAEPRFTKDLDLLIAADAGNAERVFNALLEFGAPLKDLTADDFAREGYFYQMGRPPLRIDILMSIPGVDFDAAWPRRNTTPIAGVAVDFIGKEDLIRSKRASGRSQDLLDIESLSGS